MLSDACATFIFSIVDAADELAREAHRYAEPGLTIQYGEEVDALRRASIKAGHLPFDVDAALDLIRLVDAVLQFHDTPPETEHWREREAAMLRLVALLRPELTDAEAVEAKGVVRATGEDGSRGEMTATWLLKVLPRLTKPVYDMAVKIISDVGSATVKRMLGL